MQHLMKEFRNQRADGVAVEEVFYSEAVSKCAGHAMRWFLSVYEGLESVDMKSLDLRAYLHVQWLRFQHVT